MGLFGKNKNQMQLSVPEMSCGHCEAKIRNLLGELPEVTEVKADSRNKVATLVLNDDMRPSIEAISAALADSGYTAEPKA